MQARQSIPKITQVTPSLNFLLHNTTSSSHIHVAEPKRGCHIRTYKIMWGGGYLCSILHITTPHRKSRSVE